MSKPNIILIIGSAYSGSTALGLALHKTAAGQAYIGEFSRVPAFRQIYQLDAAGIAARAKALLGASPSVPLVTLATT